MADLPSDDFVRRIHDSQTQIVLCATGGGSLAIPWLLTVPGASRTVLEAVVPYAGSALGDWLGATPEQFCSDWTGRAMAMAAYRRAQVLASDAKQDGSSPAVRLAGIACTASLASDRPKQGPHRAHLALQTATTTVSTALELEKGARSRREEEELVARLLLNLAAEACGIADRLELALRVHEETPFQRIEVPQSWQDLLAGRVRKVSVGPAAVDELPRALLPGAFHPLHSGHRHMAAVAAEILGFAPAFEMSIVNVDKPPLDYLEIAQRAEQFGESESLWITWAATFLEKAALFPGCMFVVGADTIARIADPRYYGHDQGAMLSSIEQIGSHGCRFLVFGRAVGGRFETLADLNLPEPLRRLSEGVPEERFREDISSTELRRQGEW